MNAERKAGIGCAAAVIGAPSRRLLRARPAVRSAEAGDAATRCWQRWHPAAAQTSGEPVCGTCTVCTHPESDAMTRRVGRSTAARHQADAGQHMTECSLGIGGGPCVTTVTIVTRESGVVDLDDDGDATTAVGDADGASTVTRRKANVNRHGGNGDEGDAWSHADSCGGRFRQP